MGVRLTRKRQRSAYFRESAERLRVSCLTWRFEAGHPDSLLLLAPRSVSCRPPARGDRAQTVPAGSPPSSPPVGAVRRHVRRNGDRTARAGVENVIFAADAINRRASAPRRRSAGEVLGHPRAAVRAAADLCAARILFVIRERAPAPAAPRTQPHPAFCGGSGLISLSPCSPKPCAPSPRARAAASCRADARPRAPVAQATPALVRTARPASCSRRPRCGPASPPAAGASR